MAYQTPMIQRNGLPNNNKRVFRRTDDEPGKKYAKHNHHDVDSDEDQKVATVIPPSPPHLFDMIGEAAHKFMRRLRLFPEDTKHSHLDEDYAKENSTEEKNCHQVPARDSSGRQVPTQETFPCQAHTQEASADQVLSQEIQETSGNHVVLDDYEPLSFHELFGDDASTPDFSGHELELSKSQTIIKDIMEGRKDLEDPDGFERSFDDQTYRELLGEGNTSTLDVDDDMVIELLNLQQTSALEQSTVDKLVAWAEHKDTLQKMILHGAIFLTVDFLKKNIKSETCAIQACHLLFSLSAFSSLIAASTASLGGISLVADALAKHPTCMDLQIQACLSLASPSSNLRLYSTDKAKLKIKKCLENTLKRSGQAVDEMLVGLKAQDFDVDFAIKAMDFLFSYPVSFSEESLNFQTIHREGIQRAFRLLNALPDEQRLVDFLFDRLFFWVKRSQSLSLDCIDTIVVGCLTILKDKSNKILLAENSIRAIRRFCDMDESHRTSIVEAGGLSRLSNLVESETASQSIKQAAGDAMKILLGTDTNTCDV